MGLRAQKIAIDLTLHKYITHPIISFWCNLIKKTHAAYTESFYSYDKIIYRVILKVVQIF
jgi:hypothetical protein